MTEVIVYGLLAAAIVAGVLYAGGRTPVQIAATAGTVVGFVAAFAIIAPRARRPVEVERTDDALPLAPSLDGTPPPAAANPHAPAPDLHVDQGQSPLTDTSKGDFSHDQQDGNQRRNTGQRGHRRRGRHAG